MVLRGESAATSSGSRSPAGRRWRRSASSDP